MNQFPFGITIRAMTTNRRAFLRASAAGAAALWLTGKAQGTERMPARIIDPHVHVWDLKQFRLPWIKPSDGVLGRNYTPRDYLAAAEGLNVVKAVYVEVGADPTQRAEEARYAAELCATKGLPFAGAVVGGSPEAEGFRQYVTSLKDRPAIKGVRTFYQTGSHRNADFLAGVRLMGDIGLSFDLLADSSSLDETAEVVAACPETRFILDHCGNPPADAFAGKGSNNARAERWRADIAKLAEHSNVACKISGVAEVLGAGAASAEAVAPAVNHCLDAFGPERVMFAGNWPVCLKAVTLARWVDWVSQITAERDEAYRRRLFHDNAAKWYRL
jgi:predicted TIM-barrel fold metal-dependent hydrolase